MESATYADDVTDNRWDEINGNCAHANAAVDALAGVSK